jgi:hypothetical protein
MIAALVVGITSWGMGLYFEQILPQFADPTTGRIYELKKGERHVYMTRSERFALNGLQTLAIALFTGGLLVAYVRGDFTKRAGKL